MKISFGCDHGALTLRQPVLEWLRHNGHEVIDHGTRTSDSVDYPDYAQLVCADLQNDTAEAGILICTTGIGMSMAANKCAGIRAALVHHEDEAELTRRHNHANVICLGALHTTAYEATRLIDTFLRTSPEGGRHARRVAKFCSLSHSEHSNTTS